MALWYLEDILNVPEVVRGMPAGYREDIPIGPPEDIQWACGRRRPAALGCPLDKIRTSSENISNVPNFVRIGGPIRMPTGYREDISYWTCSGHPVDMW